VVDPLRQRIADERAKLEVEFAKMKQAYEEKKRLLDEFERVVLGASRNGTSESAQQEGALSLSQAVRFALKHQGAKTNGEVTDLVRSMTGVKLPKGKRLPAAVSLALYSMRRSGEVELDEATRKYRLVR
jgi:hypothetical protein